MATKAGDVVFAAGVLAADFKTGVAPEARVPSGLPLFGSPIKLQTEYVLGNVESILRASGSSLHDVIKADVILTDIRDFYGFEEVWREHFPVDPPARSVYEGGLVNPGCLVEVDVVALAGEAGRSRELIATERVPRPTIAQSLACKLDDMVFVGGQMATDFVTGVAPEARIDPNFPRYATHLEKQGRLVLENLTRILEAAGSSRGDVAKLTAYLTDAEHDAPLFVELVEEFFPSEPPAVTMLDVSALTIPGCRVMVDAIAAAS
jgi:enamine deaminase RidA (YjgF/YER057c/UK114 family)